MGERRTVFLLKRQRGARRGEREGVSDGRAEDGGSSSGGGGQVRSGRKGHDMIIFSPIIIIVIIININLSINFRNQLPHHFSDRLLVNDDGREIQNLAGPCTSCFLSSSSVVYFPYYFL